MARRNTNRRVRSRSTSLRRIIVYVIVLSGCLILLISSLGGKFGFPQQLTLEILGPVQSVFSRIAFGCKRLKDEYVNLLNIREECRLLKIELAQKEEIIWRFKDGNTLYHQLEKQLQLKKANENQFMVSARVIGKDPSFWFKTIIVDQGKKKGVTKGMVARTPEGVVGQVIHVSNNYAKILLANAPSSAIDAMVQKNRVRGILKGADKKGFTLHYVLKNADIDEGDMITTAGIGGVFETGIPLGKVSHINEKQRGMFLEIEVEPVVDFYTLEFVMITDSPHQLVEKEMGIRE